MANLKELRGRIKSVSSIAQITGAMEMVASMKLRKVQAKAQSFAPYTAEIRDMIQRIAAKVAGEEDVPLFTQREVNTVGFFLISSDRGLCGSYNSNLLMALKRRVEALQAEGKKVKFWVYGRKGYTWLTRRGFEVERFFVEPPLDKADFTSGKLVAEALVEALRPLQPRLYSIASSRKAVGDEAHLTVAHVEYQRGDATRWGAASHFLAAREEGAQVQVYIEHNERFRLPADGAKDIIMIGPGTGVAPFRAFVQEREAIGAIGRNWLFFGNPHAREDFLYQVEWQDALKRGALHRLDLAFSRDQASKVYVQHRLREQASELYAWLQNGAHLYVCGDATRMAKDVHAALLDIIALQGGKSAEDANDYLNALQAQGRYARDVY